MTHRKEFEEGSLWDRSFRQLVVIGVILVVDAEVSAARQERLEALRQRLRQLQKGSDPEEEALMEQIRAAEAAKAALSSGDVAGTTLDGSN